MTKCESCKELCEKCGEKIEYEPNPISMRMLSYNDTFLDVWGFKIMYFFLFCTAVFSVIFSVFVLSKGIE